MKVTKTKKTKRHVVPKSVRRKLRQNAKAKRAIRRDKMAEIKMALRFSDKNTHIVYINNYIGLIAEDILRISNALNPAVQFMDTVTTDPELQNWFKDNAEQVDLFVDQIDLIDKHIEQLRKVRADAEAARDRFVAFEHADREEMIQEAYIIILGIASVTESSFAVDKQVVDLVQTIGELNVDELRGK